MLILNSPEIAQATLLRWKTEHRVALVPTMGALHEGHLCLVRLAKTLAERVVVSLFVNPLQFGPGEDLEKYPRTFEEDRALLQNEGVALLFTPSAAELYPEGFQSKVMVGELAKHLCGVLRPGHFAGVATVCLKLFEITRADVAVFGEKDFQQLQIIRQMVSDFNLPLTVVSYPIVRESDGLALSSRNGYLTPDERRIASCLPRTLLDMDRKAYQSETAIDLVADTTRRLSESFVIDYVALCSEDNLVPVITPIRISEIPRPRLFVAVRLGRTRLIDNISLKP